MKREDREVFWKKREEECSKSIYRSWKDTYLKGYLLRYITRGALIQVDT